MTGFLPSRVNSSPAVPPLHLSHINTEIHHNKGTILWYHHLLINTTTPYQDNITHSSSATKGQHPSSKNNANKAIIFINIVDHDQIKISKTSALNWIKPETQTNQFLSIFLSCPHHLRGRKAFNQLKNFISLLPFSFYTLQWDSSILPLASTTARHAVIVFSLQSTEFAFLTNREQQPPIRSVDCVVNQSLAEEQTKQPAYCVRSQQHLH